MNDKINKQCKNARKNGKIARKYCKNPVNIATIKAIKTASILLSKYAENSPTEIMTANGKARTVNPVVP